MVVLKFYRANPETDIAERTTGQKNRRTNLVGVDRLLESAGAAEILAVLFVEFCDQSSQLHAFAGRIARLTPAYDAFFVDHVL